ncbi:MAG: histidine--tRNA ligase [Planctomycetes bacterium]|nr:histidine--tRNA ligase [Planctomycetota bacterium]NUQ34621.1 histidine--tRNA ligase [Planctomycetaceae bacterium]
MAKVEPRILKGFRDYPPELMIPRMRMVREITEVFERFGFAPLDTPAIEYSDVLLGKYGGETDKQVTRFKDQGDRDVTMRFDLTVPLARFMAMNRQLPKPFKRYQVGNVWRGEKPGPGRFREFMQCDADIVGSSSMMCDAECLVMAHTIMKRLGLDAIVQVNNRLIFRGMQQALGIDSDEQMTIVLRILDKYLKIGEKGVREELARDATIDGTRLERICEYLRISGGNEDVLRQMESMLGSAGEGKAGITQLREVFALIAQMDAPASAFQIVPSLVRGADYYTGTIFEIVLPELISFGSMGSGGRYDGLIGMFLNEDVPAIGLSMGIDRTLAALEELKKLPVASSPAKVFVTAFSAEQYAYSIRIATVLRAAAIPTELALDPDAKFKKQMSYASAKGIPLVVIAGPDEAAKNVVTVKDMTAGTQSQHAIDTLAAHIKGALQKTPPEQPSGTSGA